MPLQRMQSVVTVTRWLNLYYSDLHKTIYRHSFTSKKAADDDFDKCFLVFDRPRMGDKAFRMVYPMPEADTA